MRRVVPFLAVLLSLAAPNLPAQRLDRWQRFEPAAPFEQVPDRVKVGHYGLEGLAIGAVALGVVGLLAAGESCGNGAPGTTCSPRSSESLLIGAGIGALLGLVVGSLIPKYGPAPAP